MIPHDRRRLVAALVVALVFYVLIVGAWIYAVTS